MAERRLGEDSRRDTCVYSRIIRGDAESEKITLCDRLFEVIRIPFKVRECSDYVDKRLPCIEDLEEIAWQLRSKSAGKTAGFVPVASAEDLESEDDRESEVPQENPPEAPGALPAVAEE